MDLRAVEVVENAHYGAGCSSSIAAALEHVDERCDVLVLMLGDQPGVGVANVEALLDGARRGAAGRLRLPRRPRPPAGLRALHVR